MNDDKIIRHIERIAGRIEPDGDTIQPAAKYHLEVKALANEVRWITLYPRDDLGSMPDRLRSDVARFFDGKTALVPTRSVIDNIYGQPARRVEVTRIGPEGEKFEAVEACALLRRFPLIITARPPAPTNEKKKEK